MKVKFHIRVLAWVILCSFTGSALLPAQAASTFSQNRNCNSLSLKKPASYSFPFDKLPASEPDSKDGPEESVLSGADVDPGTNCWHSFFAKVLSNSCNLIYVASAEGHHRPLGISFEFPIYLALRTLLV
jgi:hypothetical protein